jgi:hypothetical protein
MVDAPRSNAAASRGVRVSALQKVDENECFVDVTAQCSGLGNH